MVKFSKFILIQSVIIFFIALFPVLSWGEFYIKEISNLNISTPLLFGGGIRSKRRLKDLHSLPIERVLFSSCSFGTKKDISLIEEAKKVFIINGIMLMEF